MRILAALTYYHPHWTGLTRVAQQVAEGLVARGHDVTVLTSHYRRDLPYRETLNGVDVIRLPTLLRVSRGMIMPAFAQQAARLMRQHDVVQIHTPMLEASLLSALAKRAGIRSVITHHGDLVMPSTRWDQFVERLVTALLASAFRTTDRAVVYTRDYLDASWFLRPFRDKCIPISPPAEIVEPDPDTVAKQRKELGLAGHRVVGFAGRFVEEKGFDFLLKAIPLIKREMPDARFAYAGDRNAIYENFFERCRPLVAAVESDVCWMGLLLDRQAVANFYAMCDVIAVPSRTDTFNLVQVEAMLCGTPVVITDIPGARVPVNLTGMGRLVRPCDEHALAEGLLEVLRYPQGYRVPRTTVESIFNHPRAIDEYEQALATW